MTATPRAMELIGPIRNSLSQIEETIFGPQEFDKQNSDVCFHVGVSDYTAAVLTPRMVKALSTEMPQASIALHATHQRDVEALLSSGKIDVASRIATLWRVNQYVI